MLRRILTIGALVALTTTGLAVVPTPAGADNFTVTVATDGHGAGTLRWAFDQANDNDGPDTITLGSGVTYNLTLPGDDDDNTGGDLDSTNGAITIIGNGSTINQTLDYNVIDQDDTELIEVQNVTITGGNHTDGHGGGIWSNDDVTVTDSTITGNSASDFGGGIYTDSGTVTVTRSTISDNTAGSIGGGIYQSDGGTMMITHSTISGNVAGNVGGGIYAYDDVTINNSTVTGNTAGEIGGGLYLEAYELYGHFNTISGNTAYSGSNISLGLGGTIALWGSVVSNPLGNMGENCEGWATSASGGYNYEADGDTCGFDQATDTADGADPLLGALAANGGPTQTMLPQSGSPLIDVIPTSDADCSGDDQRGIIRPQGNGCEIGSVEIEVIVPTTTTTTTTTTAAPTTTTTAAARPQPLTPTFTG